MKILYTCDNNYVWLMGISVISLFETNLEAKELDVYLLGDRISLESKMLLDSIAKKYSRRIIIRDTESIEIPESLCDRRWPKSAYTRLFSGQLLPDFVDRILYLDCDTIVNDTLENVYNQNMNGNTICAVQDCVSRRYKTNIGCTVKQPYFNAGVLLLDINKLRTIDISKKISTFIKKYQSLIYYADQDVLNGVFSGVIGTLPADINVMTILFYYSYDELKKLRKPDVYYDKEDIEKAVFRPRIIHFTTCMKILRPWYENANHPFTEVFLRYKDMSPWKDTKLATFKFNKRKEKLFSFINMLPRKFSIRILGMLHTFVVPFKQKVCSNCKGE